MLSRLIVLLLLLLPLILSIRQASREYTVAVTPRLMLLLIDGGYSRDPGVML